MVSFHVKYFWPIHEIICVPSIQSNKFLLVKTSFSLSKENVLYNFNVYTQILSLNNSGRLCWNMNKLIVLFLFSIFLSEIYYFITLFVFHPNWLKKNCVGVSWHLKYNIKIITTWHSLLQIPGNVLKNPYLFNQLYNKSEIFTHTVYRMSQGICNILWYGKGHF